MEGNNQRIENPAIGYGQRKWVVKSFESFDDMEDEQLKYFASLSHEELLLSLKRLSLAAYGLSEEIMLQSVERKIYFDTDSK